MDQVAGGIMSFLIFLAVIYAFGRALIKTVVAPIHEKLDRIIGLRERILASQSSDARESV